MDTTKRKIAWLLAGALVLGFLTVEALDVANGQGLGPRAAPATAASLSAAGAVLKTNNGSDFSSIPTTRTNLGLAIGTNVQAYNSNLTAINQALTSTSSPSFNTVTAALTGTASGNVTSVTCNGTAITTSGTCSTKGQVPGTTTNDSASAGNVGEVMTATRTGISALSLTSATQTNLFATPITLTAGQWDCSIVGDFKGAVGTTVTDLYVAMNTTSATLPASGDFNKFELAVPSATAIYGGGGEPTFFAGPWMVQVATTQIVYGVVYEVFAVSTSSVYGSMRCIRTR